MTSDKLPQLKVSTGWIDVSVIDEPTVLMTFRGYAPVLPVRVEKTGLEYFLFISAKSIGEALDPLRESNGGRFIGLEFSIRKAGTDQFSRYEIKGRS